MLMLAGRDAKEAQRAWKAFRRGIDAAREAGLPRRINVVVPEDNASEADEMAALADEWNVENHAKVSICKAGRDDRIDLMAEGVDGLTWPATLGPPSGPAHCDRVDHRRPGPRQDREERGMLLRRRRRHPP
ncbi:hypothetical protein [Streptomyces rubiginosohelvolus]|uniref:hypothetical protein n=1 Tax=Streptomyces rubiginosohelvolus TaxID=67362 RepID=UPI003862E069|nr:hypothetical protein OG475_00070 [Streptomyces rubiginosohelvolus]WST57730.1 hypothetical protein OG475_34905 [Streptomyces rubiginosohelvolus]